MKQFIENVIVRFKVNIDFSFLKSFKIFLQI